MRGNKLAFTLAEVLVTLGIIGVVSAMTVPSLMNHYQRQTYVTQLHKAYTEMNQAVIQYQTDRNALNLRESGLTSINSLYDFINNYFKVVNECDTLQGCFADNYKNLNGGNANFGQLKSYVLASGVSIRPSFNGVDGIYFAVDVNGLKGPNILGRDCFFIFISNNGLIDDNASSLGVLPPLSKDQREQLFEQYCKDNGTTGCFGKILNDNWQMTY